LSLISVWASSSLTFPMFLISIYSITDLESNDSKEILHYHYTTWPDFGVPQCPTAFLRFLADVRQSGALDQNVGPPIVHCSAGIGRSGTFCLVDTCLIVVSIIWMTLPCRSVWTKPSLTIIVCLIADRGKRIEYIKHTRNTVGNEAVTHGSNTDTGAATFLICCHHWGSETIAAQQRGNYLVVVVVIVIMIDCK